MRIELLAIAGGVLCASAVFTGLVRRLALARGILDVPVSRSSHTTPTPRGGGVAIVVTAVLAVLALAALGYVPAGVSAALAAGGVAVALVGFLDDLRGVSVAARLAVHVVAALCAVAALGGMPPVQVGTEIMTWGWIGTVIAVIAIIWSINLFNFMDGIDGIAGAQAVFVFLGAVAIAAVTKQWGPPELLCVVIGAAACGFLVWNWPPARIFMGDVGSSFLGYVIVFVALFDGQQDPVAPFVWLILNGVFVADASVTVLRRLIRHEPLHQAHRSHAYQWLARRWSSHRRVTLAVVFVNVAVLLPLAWFAMTHPEVAGLIAAACVVSLGLVALMNGAGRAEVGVKP